MSSPSSELTWLSSDGFDELEELIDLEEPEGQQIVWKNQWTAINHPTKSIVATPFSPPPPQPDTEDDDEPPESASHLRGAILTSAQRMYETKRARKRKFVPASPPTARKKQAIVVNSELVNVSAGPAQEKKSSAKKPRAANSRIAQTQVNDSLLPIRPSKLNTTFNVEKRKAIEAFGDDIESRPPKKLETVRGGNMSTGKFITDSVAHGQTKPVPFLFDSSPEMFHSDTENTLHIGEEDSEDLFDNDDTYIEEFLEFEKTTFAETASSLPLPSERSAELQLQTTTTTIGKAPSGTTPSPMKPFVRPFTPLPSSQDTSATGSAVSPLHRSPICFRIAEALRYTFFSSPTTAVRTLHLEVYAILHASVKSGDASTVTLADIFSPQKPPYLKAIAKHATIRLPLVQEGNTASSSQLEKMRGNLIRAIIQVSSHGGVQPVATTGSLISPVKLLAENYITTVLKVEQSNWKEIERVKNILDGKEDADAVAKGQAPGNVGIAEVRNNSKNAAAAGAVKK